MANNLHTYVRQDTTPDDSRDNLRDKGQTDRELESFRHDEGQDKGRFNDDFASAPEQTDLESGMTMRETLSADVGGDATRSVAPSRTKTRTFGNRKRSSSGRGRGRSRGIENGRTR